MRGNNIGNPIGGIIGFTDLSVTSTEKIQKPVDYKLIQSEMWSGKYDTFERMPGAGNEFNVSTPTRSRRLAGGKPGFTTRTDNRGFD